METTENYAFKRNKNNKVALYIRANNHEGIKTQLLRAIAYANEKGISISPSRMYADVCSGTESNRPAFKKMLSENRKKKFATVLVTDTNRLGRTPEVQMMSQIQMVMRGLTMKVAK